ncbi:hypothetical protein [Roseovarius aestuariivivens]|nr:hypothetical protein [Roseovarius aestuariivivens]
MAKTTQTPEPKDNAKPTAATKPKAPKAPRTKPKQVIFDFASI